MEYKKAYGLERLDKQRLLTVIYYFAGISVFFPVSHSVFADDNKSNKTVTSAGEKPIKFNPAFLLGGQGVNTDLSVFESGSGLLPGSYDADIYVNNEYLKSQKINFSYIKSKHETAPCMTKSLLLEAGVKDEALIKKTEDGRCSFINDLIQGASSDVDPSRMRIDISIPQAYINRQVKGFVPVSALDRGSAAAYLNYSGSYYDNNVSGAYGSQASTFFSIQSGINLADWFLRNNSSIRYTRQNGTKFTDGNTYLQRPMPELRSNLLVGEASTTGAIFDSLSFRGARVSSDERMLSPNKQGYAPVVRGTAESNSRIVIRQGSNIVYETTVPPGNFVIDDLYPTQNAGDLMVEVTESSGKIHTFTVPFSAVSTSLRPGLYRYAVTAGKTNSLYSGTDNAGFVEGTYERGISNALTLNGGLQIAQNDYYSFSTGGVFATPIGAFGTNVNYSFFDHDDVEKSSGWQFKSAYNATYTPTNTSLMLAAYKYSTSGYISLADSLAKGKTPYYFVDDTESYIRSSSYKQKNRFEVNLSQPLQGIGSLYANFIKQDYYNGLGSDTQYQTGFQSTIGVVSYNIGFARQTVPSQQKNDNERSQNVISLSISVPLNLINKKLGSLNTSVSHYDRDGSLYQTNMSGVLGDNHEYAYNIYQTTDKRSNLNSYGAGVTRDTSFGSYGIGYARSTHSSIVSGSARGAVVGYTGGIVAGPYVGETFGIIEAPGAEGASVTSTPGVKVNYFGKAIIPSLSPYRYNLVTLDPKGINANAELEETQRRIAPVAGAIPVVRFKTLQGYPLLLETRRPDGSYIPLGASVTDAYGNSIGVVGQGSQLYARVAEVSGALKISWEQAGNHQCTVRYDIPKRAISDALIHLNGICQ